jgi:uncharacterized membrane protein
MQAHANDLSLKCNAPVPYCPPPATALWDTDSRSSIRAMFVDVLTEIDISRPVAEVAAFAADPDNAPRWYFNIKSVEWKSDRPLSVGSRVAFVAHFLGRRMAYTYEFVEIVSNERLVMRTAEGPFPMETTYTWTGSEGGRTQMRLRNRGSPSGFYALMAPMMAIAMRRANRADLARLKKLLEIPR